MHVMLWLHYRLSTEGGGMYMKTFKLTFYGGRWERTFASTFCVSFFGNLSVHV